MSTPNPASPWMAPLSGPQFKPTVILLSSAVLTLAWKYFCDPHYLASLLPQNGLFGQTQAAAGAIGSFAGGLLLLGLIPALIVKFVFHERLADYGVQLGNRLYTFRSMAVWVPIFILMAYLNSGDAAMRAEYPVNPSAGDSPAAFALHAVTYVMLYIGWEFHFRGFLQFGLRESAGAINSALIGMLGSTLLHIGKPASETFACILGGLLWGFFAYRTQSLLSGLAQHFLLGLSLDWFLTRAGS